MAPDVRNGKDTRSPRQGKSSLRESSLFGSHAGFILGAVILGGRGERLALITRYEGAVDDP